MVVKASSSVIVESSTGHTFAQRTLQLLQDAAEAAAGYSHLARLSGNSLSCSCRPGSPIYVLIQDPSLQLQCDAETGPLRPRSCAAQQAVPVTAAHTSTVACGRSQSPSMRSSAAAASAVMQHAGPVAVRVDCADCLVERCSGSGQRQLGSASDVATAVLACAAHACAGCFMPHAAAGGLLAGPGVAWPGGIRAPPHACARPSEGSLTTPSALMQACGDYSTSSLLLSLSDLPGARHMGFSTPGSISICMEAAPPRCECDGDLLRPVEEAAPCGACGLAGQESFGWAATSGQLAHAGVRTPTPCRAAAPQHGGADLLLACYSKDADDGQLVWLGLSPSQAGGRRRSQRAAASPPGPQASPRPHAGRACSAHHHPRTATRAQPAAGSLPSIVVGGGMPEEKEQEMGPGAAVERARARAWLVRSRDLNNLHAPSSDGPDPWVAPNLGMQKKAATAAAEARTTLCAATLHALLAEM